MTISELTDFLLSPDDRNVLIALQLMRLLEPQEIQDVLVRTYEQAKRVWDNKEGYNYHFNKQVLFEGSIAWLHIRTPKERGCLFMRKQGKVYFTRFVSDSTKDVGMQEPVLYDHFKACFIQTLDYHGL